MPTSFAHTHTHTHNTHTHTHTHTTHTHTYTHTHTHTHRAIRGQWGLWVYGEGRARKVRRERRASLAAWDLRCLVCVYHCTVLCVCLLLQDYYKAVCPPGEGDTLSLRQSHFQNLFKS